jgi:hypothetical protein
MIRAPGRIPWNGPRFTPDLRAGTTAAKLSCVLSRFAAICDQ